MNQNSFEMKNEQIVEESIESNLKCKRPIIIFSVIALIVKIIDVLLGFPWIGVDENGKMKIISNLLDGKLVLSIIFNGLLVVLPFVLFLIYILKFYNSLYGTFLIPAIFAIQAIKIGLSSYTAWNLIVLVILLLLFIGSLIKKHNRKIIIIASAIMSVLMFIDLLGCISQGITYLMNDEIADFVTLLMLGVAYYIAMLFLYVAIFLFALKNDILTVFALAREKKKEKIQKEKVQGKKLNPEQALSRLKKNYEGGFITEEEYNAQREEIMKKL